MTVSHRQTKNSQLDVTKEKMNTMNTVNSQLNSSIKEQSFDQENSNEK